MIETWSKLIPMNLLSMGIDVVLIMVLLAMWVFWWKQGKRTQRVETGLLEAAAQLQEATALLDDALNQIALLQRKSESQDHKKQVAVTTPLEDVQDDIFDDDIQPHFSSRAQDLLASQKANLDASSMQSKARVTPMKRADKPVNQGVMDVAQILRMQREGASLESIADTLNMPLAQVKLMLMLQKGT
ncbi:MAG: hypothetical protein Q9M18_06150 [Mariprofundaceae bacterium]|nr:hypothetical protein [Mariprofundaceae bacterium]